MTRISVLVLPAIALLCFVVGTLLLTAEEKRPEDQKSERLNNFLDSLKPAGGRVTDESDRCPGETAADRADSEEEEKPESPEESSTEAPTDEEPSTLPAGIDAAPIPGARAKGDDPKEVRPAVDPKFKPELLPLKEQLRDTLAWYYDHPQKANDRSPWGIMHWLIPYGVDSYILDTNGQRQNTVGYLCYNYPCKGLRLFHLEKGQIAAYIGPGLQGHRGQFLAMLAQSKVDAAYPMRVEGKAFKVADLIEYEKRTCESNTELTFKLIALAHYLKHDEKWKNAKGEDWDLPRLVREELKAPIVGAACGGTHRMTGFSYAVRKHEARHLLLDGQWSRAGKFIDDYQDYTFSIQNRDGSFSTNWFASKGDAIDPQRRLQTSGHILEWLVCSLPESQLQDKRTIEGVEYLTTLLDEGKHTRWEIGPLGHALHALALYDERVFGGKPGKRAIELSRRPTEKTEK